MHFSIGFSPCPNDTFIFDALIHQKIDTEGFSFSPVLEDVEGLNKMALNHELPISKISYGVLPLVLKHYVLLHSGGALGKGVGPLLVAKKNYTQLPASLEGLTVALPGEHTTAHLLYQFAIPVYCHKKFMLFSDIESAIVSGIADVGVIIHENRFTYQQKGLVKLLDLGSHWEERTGAPIPLGGIIIDRGIPKEIQHKINALIKKSLEYARSNYPSIPSYVADHAQEMEEDIMRKHIDLYVNNFSLDLGTEGKKAVETLLSVYEKLNHQGLPSTEIYV